MSGNRLLIRLIDAVRQPWLVGSSHLFLCDYWWPMQQWGKFGSTFSGIRFQLVSVESGRLNWVESVKIIDSPSHRSGTSFKGTDDARCDPAAVKITRLGFDFLIIDEASVNLAGVKREVPSKGFKPVRW